MMFNNLAFMLAAAASSLFLSQGNAAPAPTTSTTSFHTTERSELLLHVLPTRDTTGTRYSFSAWTDSIIANPSQALSPDQAVNAFLDSMKKNPGVDLVPPSTTWSKKEIFCETHWRPDISAKILDAATLIHRLITLGDVPCPVTIKTSNTTGLNLGVNFAQELDIYDVEGTAMLMPKGSGLAGQDPKNRGTCRSIARTTAVVMDKCTQLNGTVVGMVDYEVTSEEEKTGVFILRMPDDVTWP
ncbi:hypothetical protein B0T20DRAFT_414493 [Sordaria brevicollis]|uniref:Ecp2 effector protein domain-containing protein n=1 Tax=Sordaria brevicollis TaxID=83679 RepID=A0AAE0PBF5_SORBR|nr:hypothetical protein B0T20DRAFT_414493 [Sordaria brevicollis]